MKLEAISTINGSWLDKSTVTNGDLIKIKSEATWTVETPERPKQLVAKVRVKGQTEDFNVSINKPSQRALMEAFGDDTALWVDKIVTAAVENTRVAGKKGVMLNLIPDGYVIGEDEAGYIVIRTKVEAPTIVKEAKSKAERDEGIDIDEIGF